MPIDYAALPYWDLCASLRLARLVGDDLAGWVSFLEPFGRGDIVEATLEQDYTTFTGRALEILGSRHM